MIGEPVVVRTLYQARQEANGQTHWMRLNLKFCLLFRSMIRLNVYTNLSWVTVNVRSQSPLNYFCLCLTLKGERKCSLFFVAPISFVLFLVSGPSLLDRSGYTISKKNLSWEKFQLQSRSPTNMQHIRILFTFKATKLSKWFWWLSHVAFH